MEYQNTGTWASRFLIWFFAVMLTALFYWLLGFVLSDIGNLPGPDFSAIESEIIDAAVSKRSQELDVQLVETRRRISTEKSRQSTLRDSTDSSQRTMNQLLEIQRLNLQQGTTPNDKERAALVESEQLFLDNQQEYQRLNQQITQLEEEVRQLEVQKRTVEESLSQQRRPAYDEFNRQMERHNLRIAMWKLSVLLPLLVLGFALYIKYRTGPYWAVIYAYGIAVVIKVGLVMHEYFPARYFKYVLIGALLLATLRILIYLLRAVAFPKKAWLLRHYREAYESFLCPICEHPIRRGPLKYMSWTKRSLRRVSTPCMADIPEELYTCPACTTGLYSVCASCGSIRHTLLPACTKCGSQIPIGTMPSQ